MVDFIPPKKKKNIFPSLGKKSPCVLTVALDSSRSHLAAVPARCCDARCCGAPVRPLEVHAPLEQQSWVIQLAPNVYVIGKVINPDS